MTFLLGILGFLKKIPAIVWIIGALLLSNLFTLHMWQHTSIALKNEKTAHSTDVKNFKQAQKEADVIAEATRARLLKESTENAKQADASYRSLLSKYHTSLMRFSASQSITKQTDSDQLPATQIGDGPSPDTDLPATLIITGGDAQICAVNTARLVAVHDWAVTLPK